MRASSSALGVAPADAVKADGAVQNVPLPPRFPDELADAPLALIIEVNSLAEDCVQYLLERGAPQFDSWDDWQSSSD